MSRERAAYIAGVGQTEFKRHGGIMDRSQFQVAAEAVMAALANAGMSPQDVDGFASFSNDANEAALMQVALGVPQLRWMSMVWGGGGGGSCAAIAQAAAAIESGQAQTVVVYRGLCQGQSRRFGRFGEGRTHGNFVHPFGLFAPAQMLALQIRRHMHLHPQIREEHLGMVAVNARANANRNPRAIMHGKPMTLDDYFNSRYIAEPLRLFDCCLESDGGCAIVVTTRSRAQDAPTTPVRILAAGHGSGPGWGSGPLGSQNMPQADYNSTNSRRMARELYAAAGVTPADIDTAQIYDHFSGMVLMALEEYGFCDVGGSGDFVAAGHIAWKSGKLPINTSGGQLSEAYVHGMNVAIEGVRQLRGESTSQVEGARLCLVTGGLGVSPTSALIIGRD